MCLLCVMERSQCFVKPSLFICRCASSVWRSLVGLCLFKASRQPGRRSPRRVFLKCWRDISPASTCPTLASVNAPEVLRGGSEGHGERSFRDVKGAITENIKTH